MRRPETSYRWWGRFSGDSGGGIDNPPQVANLPHNEIVAAREESNGW